MIEFDEYKIKLQNLGPDLEDLGQALDLEGARRELAALEEESGKEGFWNDLDNSQKVLQKSKQLKDKLAHHARLVREWEDLSVLCAMAIEEDEDSLLPELEEGYAKLESDLEEARMQTLLAGEYDKNNAILSFHAGAGGTEAQDWAQMLYRMYVRWAERHRFSYKVLDYLDGDEAGIKSAVILIQGENAYGYLKSESGVHRLVRISPFDASGRRHTSFAALEVMPEIGDEVEIDIRSEDLKVDTYRSGGAGGQHVNKTESAIRITHIPTGIVVACQNERSQHQNREVAMRMLRSKLVEIKEREHLDKIEDIKGVQKAIEWGSQIRSYVFMPYTLAKDHRTGFESGNIGAVMDGDLDGFINAYLKAQATGNWAVKS
ncbi:peptide chain release factor 2 [Papillibacter cinnamivorans]|uniref:Peptide chain release factor 2 n=1 Tax=Papillibacter cinnamivorans DSM 12816 TaxID=1122930 RepID=A0A1W2A748_9FIRM|nr:peptide chain release factor 2 [Papillibacter cinnamivorans]SMC56490.1 peptide chain release factor 2 [Papillibacter cinnamivorans DSM 12816]